MRTAKRKKIEYPCWKRCGAIRTLHTAGRNVKWYNHFILGRKFGIFLGS